MTGEHFASPFTATHTLASVCIGTEKLWVIVGLIAEQDLSLKQGQKAVRLV
jgi:hypothetical protein